MPGTPKQAEAAERELGRASRSELRDRPAAIPGQQPLEAGRPRRADEATSPAPESAEQGP
jgi:hypothetical protein